MFQPNVHQRERTYLWSNQVWKKGCTCWGDPSVCPTEKNTSVGLWGRDERETFTRGFLSWNPRTPSHRLTPLGLMCVDQSLGTNWRPIPCPSTNKVKLNQGTWGHLTVWLSDYQRSWTSLRVGQRGAGEMQPYWGLPCPLALSCPDFSGRGGGDGWWGEAGGIVLKLLNFDPAVLLLRTYPQQSDVHKCVTLRIFIRSLY